MIRRIFTLAVLALTLVVAPLAARAADGPGTKVVRQANDTIAALLKQKAPPGSDAEKQAAAKVTTSVRDFLDIKELTQRALVDHWAKLTEAQRTDFLDTLRSLIEDNYVKGLRANLDYQVSYLGEEPGDHGTTVVHTQIQAKKKGRPVTIKVDYVLMQQGGKLVCFDVKTDGVGLVDNYRAQFNKIIAKEGFDGLLARMKKKRAAGT
ncbi:MAG TPA: ABC transporter substrate-binding protein [Kofleriaceae bacterium]|nr:ABC transporter substrate-binding protein [Kofleriaceae bacterium]